MAPRSIQARDGGFFVVHWFVKIALVTAVLGILAIDGISIALAHVRIGDAASQAASAGAQGYGTNKNFAGALGAAEQAATDNGGTLAPADFRIVGNVVTVTLHTTIKTLVIGHLPGTQGLLSASVVATATLDPQ